MKCKVELTVDIDPDHPYIDSLGDELYALRHLLEDLLYDDDYLELEDISVKEEK